MGVKYIYRILQSHGHLQYTMPDTFYYNYCHHFSPLVTNSYCCHIISSSLLTVYKVDRVATMLTKPSRAISTPLPTCNFTWPYFFFIYHSLTKLFQTGVCKTETEIFIIFNGIYTLALHKQQSSL